MFEGRPQDVNAMALTDHDNSDGTIFCAETKISGETASKQLSENMRENFYGEIVPEFSTKHPIIWLIVGILWLAALAGVMIIF
jgi:hypothetical protein